jgi:hypothetical protein
MAANMQQLLDKAVTKAFLASVPVRFPYLFTLDRIHQHLRPRTYLEVGVSKGMSLALVLPGTRAVGIDPEPHVSYPLRRDTRVFSEPSDEFFNHRDLNGLLGGLPIDLAFIDGMHRFEFALRDFANLEKHAQKRTTVLVHDCYPINKETASRERTTSYWSGDVWKLIICLRKWRPDLRVSVIDVAPTGLGVITGLDPNSGLIQERYEDIVSEALDLPYEYLDERGKAEALNRISPAWRAVRELLPPTPFRFAPSQILTVERAASAWWHKTSPGAP